MSTPATPKLEKAPRKPSKSKKGLFMGVAGLVVALAGGGYWYTASAGAANAADGAAGEGANAEHATDEGERGLLALDPFVVNLVDDGGSHFLRTNIQLIIAATEVEAKEIQEKSVEIMPIRSAVLELLAQQSATALVTPEGKEALKAAIKKRASEVFHKHKISEVLFTEFVVQF
jgi:flagellar FliL protein